jgi:Tol biopolymer transport system component
VVHCDVKPGNVMVDRGGNIYLTDFGIARHAESTTTTLGTMGTAAYMAPEQIRGESVTPATDVYALGVVLYEMLTGQRPFRGNEAGTEKGGTTANERIRYAHLHLSPPDPRSLNPSIPEGLAQVILKAMAKESYERYQNTQDLFIAARAPIGISAEQVFDRVSLPAHSPPIIITGEEASLDIQPGVGVTKERKSLLTQRIGGVGVMAIGGFGIVVFILILVAITKSKGASPTQVQQSTGLYSLIRTSTPTQKATAEPGLIYTAAAQTVQAQLTMAVGEVTLETPVPTSTLTPSPTQVVKASRPPGKIVFTCQVYKDDTPNQTCIINADGTGWKLLTNEASKDHYYPSLATDGNSIVFAGSVDGDHEIFEMDLNGNMTQLTHEAAGLSAPAISPDRKSIAFVYDRHNQGTLWLMNRDGSNPRQIYAPSSGDASDPVWSPDGKQILFASGPVDHRQLYIINLDGSGLHQVTNLPDLRGRSDWSPDGLTLATYAGPEWHREIYLLNLDGTIVSQVTNGGNNLAPSFSPDGQWITFTSYRDNYGNNDGCEIYTMRINGSEITRLTSNDYCDWQPRWGP